MPNDIPWWRRPGMHLRHDAHRWIRHDAARFVRPGFDPADVFPTLARKAQPVQAPTFDDELAAEIAAVRRVNHAMQDALNEVRAALARRRRPAEAKYSPSQPRVPAGNPRGGQWTDRSGGSDFSGYGNANATQAARSVDNSPAWNPQGINDPRVISDANREGIKPGEQYAQAGGRRGSGTILINGQRVETSARQAAELQAVQARADSAIARVREIDANWKPTPSAYESVNGLIEKYRADAQQAQDRASELGRMGIGPGPFAGQSISARGPERDFTVVERREINRIGSETGCHTYGTRDPETKSGNFVVDHQIPNALNETGRAQRLYPQCVSCSVSQGGNVGKLKGLR